MALVKRLEHGKRITFRGSDGRALVVIKPVKKRRGRNGSSRSSWHLVIEESVDQKKKAI